jgi:hypothetical protein
MKKALIIILALVVVLGGAGAVYYFFFYQNLSGQIVTPYIAHQKPVIDPHVPASDAVSDKLDEVVFDGLFNISANASGIVYEDGLGEFSGIDQHGVVSIRLAQKKKWHGSWSILMNKEKITVAENMNKFFTADDLRFTLQRIQRLGSLSPDYILVAQAVANFDFTGPDANGVIQFQFRGDRTWTESDIKEVLSFKIVPASSDPSATEFKDGTGPYALAGSYEDEIFFVKNPVGPAIIPDFRLKPFIDNSTFTTELRNKKINTLLATPFGSESPILADSTKFFHKSNISTCFFMLAMNTSRLNHDQRAALRSIMNSKELMKRFFKIGTPQQRHIADYKGNRDNYDDYVNFSVFPKSSYYVEDQVIAPVADTQVVNASVLPDTVRIATCLNFGYREELSDMVAAINDHSMFGGRLKATAVQNDEIAQGAYDAVLIPVNGYRSNFLFDLYDVFLREPDLSTHKINLITTVDAAGKSTVDPRSFEAARNFFRLDLTQNAESQPDIKQLLGYLYAFMATHEIGDKQRYAQLIDQLEHQMALGCWLFSLPSTAYFSRQLNEQSIDLYGVASQLSTIEKWQEKIKK